MIIHCKTQLGTYSVGVEDVKSFNLGGTKTVSAGRTTESGLGLVMIEHGNEIEVVDMQKNRNMAIIQAKQIVASWKKCES